MSHISRDGEFSTHSLFLILSLSPDCHKYRGTRQVLTHH